MNVLTAAVWPGERAHTAVCIHFKSARMTKNSPPKPARPAIPAPVTSTNPFALNPNFNQQTRKMLGKHYRAKFGVK